MGSRVFVLGPGASRWPDFGDGSSVGVPPPDACFAYGAEHGLTQAFDPLWRLLRRVGIDERRLLAGTPDMDALFGIVDRVRDVLWRLHPFAVSEPTARDGGDDDALYDYWDRHPRDDLVAFLAAVLQRSTEPLQRTECLKHRRFAQALEAGDTVVSLNADLLIDVALQATGSWAPSDGYGTGAFVASSLLRKAGLGSVMPPGASVEEALPRGERSGVLLLKLNGSLNWWREYRAASKPEIAGMIERRAVVETLLLRTEAALTVPLGRSDGESDVARARLSGLEEWQLAPWFRSRSNTGADAGPRLGPPSLLAGEAMSEDYLFHDVWNAAARAFSHAREVFIIGYGFPEGHATFQVLLAHALTRAARRPEVTVVDPDPDAVVARAKRSGIVPVDGWRRRAVDFSTFVAEMP
jgi:hypothetical protein